MASKAIDWSHCAALIEQAQRMVLTAHQRPDCDCLGSELALAEALEALGKEVRIVNPDAVPEHLNFLGPVDRVAVIERDVAAAELADYDTLIVLDTGAWSQLGAMGDVVRQIRPRTLVIDHHVSGDDLGAAKFHDPQAEATGRLVFDLLTHLGIQLTKSMAGALFAAVATDTGWFRFNATTDITYRCAAELVAAGASPPAIYNQLFEQQALARLHLAGRILAGAQTELDGRLIYASVTREDFDETGASDADTEEVINRTLEVAGTEVALLFVALRSGETKVSLRSRSRVDCSQIAGKLGGGGHRAASGARSSRPLDDFREAVLQLTREAILAAQ